MLVFHENVKVCIRGCYEIQKDRAHPATSESLRQMAQLQEGVQNGIGIALESNWTKLDVCARCYCVRVCVCVHCLPYLEKTHQLRCSFSNPPLTMTLGDNCSIPLSYSSAAGAVGMAPRYWIHQNSPLVSLTVQASCYAGLINFRTYFRACTAISIVSCLDIFSSFWSALEPIG